VLYACHGAHTLFNGQTERVRKGEREEGERKRVREGDREREGGRERKRERE
jgi:hypothetical protein